MKKTNTLYVTQAAVIAALYVVLTVFANALGLASQVIQIRFSEALTILPCFTAAAIPGLFAGCFLANLITGCAPWDILFGSLATLIGAAGTYFLSHKIVKERSWIKYFYPLPSVLANMIIVPLVLAYVYQFEGSYWLFAGTVGAGEIVSCYLLGYILYFLLFPYRYLLFGEGCVSGNPGKKEEPWSVRSLTQMAALTALTVICAWITIPYGVPFTMQTFAVFTASGLLGGKKGTLAIFLYVLLGALGLPVFSGFGAGLGWILGPTGGYIIGFVLQAAVSGILIDRFGRKTRTLILSMLLGLFVCYAFGTVWFVNVYTVEKGAIGVGTALLKCVIPYIIPDVLKLLLAVYLVKRVRKITIHS